MEQQALPALPDTDNIVDLMEVHRYLVALYGAAPAQESDSYSLAQPSPLRFVPTLASNQMPPLTLNCQGE